MLPDFFFSSLFPVQQTTSGIGHRVRDWPPCKVVFFGLATNIIILDFSLNNNNYSDFSLNNNNSPLSAKDTTTQIFLL